MDEKEMKQAKIVYETICKSMDDRGWHYKREEEDMVIRCGARGDDLPMDIIIHVNTKAQVVSLISPLPYKIKEDKRVEAALAICVANYGLVNGSFDYDLSDGSIHFRVVSSYRESILGTELFDYMIGISVHTVDKYNDKFLMISSGMMSFEQFLEWENNPNNG
jgi:hypothetical protein